VQEFLNRGITSPIETARLCELNYGKKLSPEAFTNAMRIMRISARERSLLKSQFSEKVQKLRSCGKDLSLFPKDIRKCPYCGIDLSPSKCPKCKRDLTAFPTDIVYCPYCSALVSEFLKQKSLSLPFPKHRHFRYSEEEDRTILELHKAGKSNKKIGEFLGRTTTIIRRRIRLLEKKTKAQS
jgi:predicted Zn-ribbon and HTH transcriptional regulator